MNSEGEHVFFPGGYRSPVLNALDELYREAVLTVEPWTAADVRAIATRLSEIEKPDHGLLIVPRDLERARRARILCIRSLDGNNLARAAHLASYLVSILETARLYADQDDARSRRRSNAGLAKNRPKGRMATKADAIRALVKRFPSDPHRASKIARIVGCSPAYVRKVLREE